MRFDEQRELAVNRCVTHHICDCMDWRLMQAERRAREARREALEEAAGVCDRLAADMYDDGARRAARAAWDCASAIRALADAPDAGAGG